MGGITTAFSSLSLDERLTDANKNKSFNLFKDVTHFTSLPNITSSKSVSEFAFVHNNYSRCEYESEAYQPIDFSKKYSEINTKAEKPNAFKEVVKNYNNSFSIYAETDLDQPTNYSLRYAEDDSSSEEENKVVKNVEFVQDTIKTYYTEDTPYETPFNFSTSTSMSDLRIYLKDSEKDKEKKNTSTQIKNEEIKSNTKNKSIFDPGLETPEKPINYCEESTTDLFSRIDSFSSLTLISTDNNANKVSTDLKKPHEPERKTSVRIQKSNEAKAVKFEEIVNYAEETPLMFSRSSSLASLDSIEQHSIHDDRSSVISDFSRLTSGLVSPSELPDSPSQTVPQSPKPRKNPNLYPVKVKTEPETQYHLSEVRSKPCVFEDVITKFKTESTPIGCSTTTSLSNLTFDDYSDTKVEDTPDLLEQIKKQDVISDAISEDEGDEDILAACINIGIQKNRYSQTTIECPTEFLYECIEINNNRFTPRNSPQHLVPPEDAIPEPEPTSNNVDTIKTYCTEDTPAILSHAGSNSDLSTLSITDNPKSVKDDLPLLFDDENISDEDLLLSECIQSAIPKHQSSTKPSSTIMEESKIGSNQLNSSLVNVNDDDINSTDEYDEEDLLKECILAGMPKNENKKNPNNFDENEELTEAERVLLEQCILEGMPKRKKNVQSNDGLTETEQDLLNECILSGMPKKDATSLTNMERTLLQQCIISGMPKKERLSTASLPSSSKINYKDHVESRNECCIHCPRNKQKNKNTTFVKSRKKNKVQFRERTDINIFYVTSHTLALKKDFGTCREEWV